MAYNYSKTYYIVRDNRDSPMYYRKLPYDRADHDFYYDTVLRLIWVMNSLFFDKIKEDDEP